ncbi:hypothetical protein [Nocardia sp. NBC_01009]|nr:hypothetical protein OHA42_09900 [Nocardia sp. NBC_01009]
MFQATHGPSNSARTAAGSAIVAGSPAAASLSFKGTFAPLW